MDGVEEELQQVQRDSESLESALVPGQPLEVIRGAESKLVQLQASLANIREQIAEFDKDPTLSLLSNVVLHFAKILQDKLGHLEELVPVCLDHCAELKKTLGSDAFKAGQFESALAFYDEAIGLNNSKAIYHTNKALALQKLERHEEAFACAALAISLDKTLLKAYIISIKCQIKLNKLLDAVTTLEAIPVANKQQPDVVEMRGLVSVACKDSGNAALKESQFDAALEMYSLAIRADDSNYVFYSNRSACYQSKRMWAEALRDAEAVVKLNPKFPKGYLHMARSQLQLKKVNDAAATVKNAVGVLGACGELQGVQVQLDQISAEIHKSQNSAQSITVSANEIARAEAFKSKGNEYYKEGMYQEAIRHYSQAIAACPNQGSYFGNRAACWVMLKEYKRAINDCTEGLALEKTPGELDKLRLRKVTSFMNTGRLDEAIDLINKTIADNELIPNGLKRSMEALSPFEQHLTQLTTVKGNVEAGRKALDCKEYSRAKRLFQNVQTAGLNDDVTVRVMLARAHLGLGELEDASRESQKAISSAGGSGAACINAYDVRAEALAGLGFTDQACKHYTAALQLDPDNQEIVKKLKFLRKVVSETNRIKAAIDIAMNERKFETAALLCGEGLAIDKTSKHLMADMHFRRAKAYHMLARAQQRGEASCEETAKAAAAVADSDDDDEDDDEDDEAPAARRKPSPAAPVDPEVYKLSYRKCLQDTNSALYYDKGNLDAIYLKVDALQAQERFEEAVHELEHCTKSGAGQEDSTAHNKLKEAQMLLKKSKRKDLYGILGVERGSLASDQEIKKAYRKAALKWHPDRHSGATGEKKAEAEHRFKEIGDAFELLTDPMRRKLWDEGHDRDEIEQKVEMDKQRREGGGGMGGMGGMHGFHF